MARLQRLCPPGIPQHIIARGNNRHVCFAADAAEEYVLVCQRYIELNPVRANMVANPSDYRWSSYRCNGLGNNSQLWTPHEVYLALGRQDDERLMAYQALFTAHIDQVTLDGIRATTNKGLALGSERFKAQVEALTTEKHVGWDERSEPQQFSRSCWGSAYSASPQRA